MTFEKERMATMGSAHGGREEKKMPNEGLAAVAAAGSPPPVERKRGRKPKTEVAATATKAAKPAATDRPAKKKRAREKFADQVTVRVERKLLTISRNHAASENLTLTDAVEDALWDWVQKKGKTAPLTTRSGRFMWNVIPLDLQRLTLRFWAFMWKEQEDVREESLRKFVEGMLRLLPEGRAQAELEQMAARFHRPGQDPADNPVLASKDVEALT
jgi:hypothetical protein